MPFRDLRYLPTRLPPPRPQAAPSRRLAQLQLGSGIDSNTKQSVAADNAAAAIQYAAGGRTSAGIATSLGATSAGVASGGTAGGGGTGGFTWFKYTQAPLLATWHGIECMPGCCSSLVQPQAHPC